MAPAPSRRGACATCWGSPTGPHPRPVRSGDARRRAGRLLRAARPVRFRRRPVGGAVGPRRLHASGDPAEDRAGGGAGPVAERDRARPRRRFRRRGCRCGRCRGPGRSCSRRSPRCRPPPRPLAAAEMALVRLAYAADLPTPDEALRSSGPTRSPPGAGGRRTGSTSPLRSAAPPCRPVCRQRRRRTWRRPPPRIRPANGAAAGRSTGRSTLAGGASSPRPGAGRSAPVVQAGAVAPPGRA